MRDREKMHKLLAALDKINDTGIRQEILLTKILRAVTRPPEVQFTVKEWLEIQGEKPHI